MKWGTIVWVGALAGFSMATPAVRGEDVQPPATTSAAGDAQRAQALLARAVALYRKQGDKAFAAFDNPTDFVDGELYVFVLGTDGVMLASGGSSAALIGRKVMNMTDAFGTPFFWDMLEKAKTSDSGTVEYRWLNKLDHKTERKITYFQKVGARLLAVGYYILGLPRTGRSDAGASSGGNAI